MDLKPREQARKVGFECGGVGVGEWGGWGLPNILPNKIFQISNLLKRGDGGGGRGGLHKTMIVYIKIGGRSITFKIHFVVRKSKCKNA